VTVPDVVGQAQATAEANIVAANLVVGTVTTSYSAVVPAGDVISQSPIGGTSVAPGSSVDIEVSLGEDISSVIYEAEDAVLSGPTIVSDNPGYTGTGYINYKNATGDYVEWTVTAASGGGYDFIFRYGLGDVAGRSLEIKVNGVVVDPSLNFPDTGAFGNWDTVALLSVTLNAGANTVRATTIGFEGPNIDHLAVSAGTSVTVPDVVGQAQATAEANIVAANLVVGTVTNAYSAVVPAGDVISQNPIGGTSVATGSSVDIEVSLGVQPAPPAAPSGLSATAISTTQIDISWTDNATNETGFKIERSDRNNANYVQIATVGADVTSFSDTGLKKNTTYFYRVRATNGDGDSAYSNEASTTTPK
jgi:hypothetical protein